MTASSDRVVVRAWAPGRVNLIGDHTDYAGGVALPMAIDLGTRVEGRRGGAVIRLASTATTGAATLATHIDDPAAVTPPWARYAAGVVHELAAAGRTVPGFDGVVRSTLPLGAGLSSSASLEVAVALALGFDGTPSELATLCQRAEQTASGVPCGVMDQLASTSGVADHALLMDFAAGTVEPVPLPDDVEVAVVHSGEDRTLVGSAYAERRAACERAAAAIGPLAHAAPDDVAAVPDPTDRARARHVISECARVRSTVQALRADDLTSAGRCFVESHVSLRDDFAVSSPALDALVDELIAMPGVYGARLTGAGFGGCVVALVAPGTVAQVTDDLVRLPSGRDARGWLVRAVDGARLR